MKKVINYEGKIVDKDFAYLCGAVLAGLSLIYQIDRRYRAGKIYIFQTLRKDKSYILKVANAITALTSRHPTVRNWQAITNLYGTSYSASSTQLIFRSPPAMIDYWIKSRVLKDNSELLRKVLFRSPKSIRKNFFQAFLDAKLRIYIRSKPSDIDLYINATEEERPIVSEILQDFGLNFFETNSTKRDRISYMIHIQQKEDVNKIFTLFDLSSHKKVQDALKRIRRNER